MHLSRFFNQREQALLGLFTVFIQVSGLLAEFFSSKSALYEAKENLGTPLTPFWVSRSLLGLPFLSTFKNLLMFALHVMFRALLMMSRKKRGKKVLLHLYQNRSSLYDPLKGVYKVWHPIN